ncbi:MAG: protein-L-isoaspartate O-methyltransferase [Gammaproteobacteria bacterium]|nr:protein-L-isoaspartate O-methyltransferase [Gammaproteobacteria bacterium]
MNLQAARDNMIEQQVRPWDVLDQRVLDIFAKVPREHFLPDSLKSLAFSDTRLPIGYGRKMLNPNIEGRILQNLALGESDQVLEVGTGSGYLTACLASLSRHVESLEIIPELASGADNKLKELGISNYKIEVCDASANCGKGDLYDAIVLSGSTSDIPSVCKEKLAIDGKLFCFVGKHNFPVHHAVLVTRISETEWSEEKLFETWVEPLDNF